jgi:hypothetical protein
VHGFIWAGNLLPHPKRKHQLRVLRRAFRCKKQEITEGWRKLHEHVACMRRMKNSYII